MHVTVCPHMCYMPSLCKSHACHMSLTCMSHAVYIHVTCRSHACHVSFTCMSHFAHMHVMCRSYACHTCHMLSTCLFTSMSQIVSVPTNTHHPAVPVWIGVPWKCNEVQGKPSNLKSWRGCVCMCV